MFNRSEFARSYENKTNCQHRHHPGNAHFPKDLMGARRSWMAGSRRRTGGRRGRMGYWSAGRGRTRGTGGPCGGIGDPAFLGKIDDARSVLIVKRLNASSTRLNRCPSDWNKRRTSTGGIVTLKTFDVGCEGGVTWGQAFWTDHCEQCEIRRDEREGWSETWRACGDGVRRCAIERTANTRAVGAFRKSQERGAGGGAVRQLAMDQVSFERLKAGPPSPTQPRQEGEQGKVHELLLIGGNKRIYHGHSWRENQFEGDRGFGLYLYTTNLPVNFRLQDFCSRYRTHSRGRQVKLIDPEKPVPECDPLICVSFPLMHPGPVRLLFTEVLWISVKIGIYVHGYFTVVLYSSTHLAFVWMRSNCRLRLYLVKPLAHLIGVWAYSVLL